jgi:hypothetical protein
MATLVGLRRNGAFAATAPEQRPAMMTTTTTPTALSIDNEETTLEQPPPEQLQLYPHHHTPMRWPTFSQHVVDFAAPDARQARVSGPGPRLSVVQWCDTSIDCCVLRQTNKRSISLLRLSANWFYQRSRYQRLEDVKKLAADAKSLDGGGDGENEAGHLTQRLPRIDAFVAELADMCRLVGACLRPRADNQPGHAFGEWTGHDALAQVSARRSQRVRSEKRVLDATCSW